MFLFWPRQLPHSGDQTPASVPPTTEGRSTPTNTPVFPPSSLILQSFARFYIFFSAGQVLLSTLCLKVCSWCISGERCTPYPPTLPPSFSPRNFLLDSLSNENAFLWKKLIGELATDTTGFPSDSCGGLYKLLISSLKILKIMHIQVSRLNKICNF